MDLFGLINENLIVSFTSWKDRIEFVPETLRCLLELTVLPKYIELNLSEEEFKSKEWDLPNELIRYTVYFELIHINWCPGNTKVFKKLIPVIQKYYGQNYLVATIDDDIKYRKDYLETLLNYYNKYLTSKFCLANIPDCGGREIYRLADFKSDLWEKLNNDVIDYLLDDYYYRYYLNRKNKTAANLNNLEWKELAKDLIIDIDTGTKKLSDVYCENGRLNEDYVRAAINNIHKIKF